MKRAYFGRSAIVLALSGMLAASAAPCRAEETPAQRFAREYPTAAGELVARYAHVKGLLRLKKHPGRGPERLYSGTFAADHGMWKMDLVRDDPGGPAATMVSCSGGDSEFLVARNPGNSEYVVLDVRQRNSAAIRAEAYEELRYFYTAAYAVLGWPLIEIMQTPEFRVVDAKAVDAPTADCIEVVYVTDGSRLGHQGTVVLDPAAGWRIRRAVATGGDGKSNETPIGQVEVSVEYAADAPGPPIPSSVSLTGPGLVARAEFSECRFEPTPREEFLLEHYGLSDKDWTDPAGPGDVPAEPTVRGKPVWSVILWANLLLVGGLIAVGTLVWRRKHRARE
jgi:hypothetical protein